jgi:parvulin-like peptidyl-prolyl isomerase
MKTKNKLFMFMCWVALLASFAGIVSAEIIDRIVAVVNDEPITQSEFEMSFAPIYKQYAETYKDAELQEKLLEARIGVLNQLIEDRLLYQDAVSKGIEVPDEEIEKRIEELESRFASKEEFKKETELQGFSLKQIKQRQKEQLAIQKLYQYEVLSKVSVSPQDVEQFYVEHSADYTSPERVKARSIMLRKDLAKETAEVTRERLSAIVEQFNAGTPFEKLASDNSEESNAATGGDLGFVEHGKMIAAIDNAIFSSEIGKVTDIVETDIGFHVFYIEARQAEKVTSLENVKGAIREQLFRERSEARYQAWVEELKQDAYISIK